jgi:hypothetical protein
LLSDKVVSSKLSSHITSHATSLLPSL